MLADLLAATVDANPSPAGESPREALAASAHELGSRLGAEARAARGSHPLHDVLDDAEAVLREHGYEPYRATNAEIRLRNCPYHPVSRRYPQSVCGMNVALVEGLVAGLRLDGVRVDFEPDPAACCVVIRAPSEEATATS
jgi:predicted ArsR family transcriptional regulator